MSGSFKKTHQISGKQRSKSNNCENTIQMNDISFKIKGHKQM